MDKAYSKMEARIEETIAEFDLEIRKLKAVRDIHNLVGRYSFFYTAQGFGKCADLWAKRKDSRCDLGYGLFDGYEGVSRCYSQEGNGTPGLMRIHTFTTPVIEVADDAMTARGVWFSPGVDTTAENGKPSCAWCWIKYGADFIFENDKWWIWHLSAYGLFHSDYYTSWGDQEAKPLRRDLENDPLAPKDGAIHADRTADRNDWTYTADRIPELDPVPPMPYKSWDEVVSEF